MLREKKITNYELTARARDGKMTVVSYNATTFYDRDRTLQDVFAAARDITERKHIEQILQEKSLEVESAKSVAERTVERLEEVELLDFRDPGNVVDPVLPAGEYLNTRSTGAVI